MCSTHPFFMARICVYKGIVETHVFLTKEKEKKFRFSREFMLVLELTGLYSGTSNTLDIFGCLQCYF